MEDEAQPRRGSPLRVLTIVAVVSAGTLAASWVIREALKPDVCCSRLERKPPAWQSNPRTLVGDFAAPVLRYEATEAARAVTSKAISGQVQLLLGKGYTFLTAGQVARAVANSRALPFRSVALTFDGTSRALVSGVMPILRRHKVRATVFVDPTAVGKNGCLGWRDIKTMANAGVEFGLLFPTRAVGVDKTADRLKAGRRAMKSRAGRTVTAVACGAEADLGLAARAARLAGLDTIWLGEGEAARPDETLSAMPRLPVRPGLSLSAFGDLMDAGTAGD